MKGIVKALIAGGVIIGVGVIILIIALSLNGWKLKGKVDFETATYECGTEISSLDVEVDAGSVRTEFYDGDKIVIEYPEADGFKTTVSEVNGTLVFKAPKRVWYKNWFLSYDIPDSVIKLPKGTAYNVKINIDAGSVYLADETYGNVDIDIDAGSFNGGNIVCNALKVNIDAGTVNVERLTAQRTVIDMDAGTATIGFTGAESDYTITARVRAGRCNLNNRTGTTDKTINVDVSAGEVSASFVG